MQPFLAILAEEETASAMESPAFYSGELGVTRLSEPWQCGHIFCRREFRILLFCHLVEPGLILTFFYNSIAKWIKTGVSVYV
jgi:hypothetical protein